MGIYDTIGLAVVAMIPLAAAIGGVVLGIFRHRGRQQLIELAHKERIAALQQGIPPEKLPPLELPPGLLRQNVPFDERLLRRAQALSVVGLLALGIGVATCLIAIVAAEQEAFGVAAVFSSIGAAFLLGARMIRKDREGIRREKRDAGDGVSPS